MPFLRAPIRYLDLYGTIISVAITMGKREKGAPFRLCWRLSQGAVRHPISFSLCAEEPEEQAATIRVSRLTDELIVHRSSYLAEP